jgi:hypothetical protein
MSETGGHRHQQKRRQDTSFAATSHAPNGGQAAERSDSAVFPPDPRVFPAVLAGNRARIPRVT